MPDVTVLTMDNPQVKIGPALSATSDMPDVKLAPPPISEEVRPVITEEKPAAESSEVPTEAAEAPAVEVKPEGEDNDGEGMPPAFKAQITRQRGLKRAAEARAAEAERKADLATTNLAKALEGIESLTKAQAAQVSRDADNKDPRPARDTFDTPEAYDSALIDWAGRRAALVATAEAQRTIESRAAEERSVSERAALDEQNRKLSEQFAQRVDKFKEAHPDYDDVMSDDVKLSYAMSQFLLNDDSGPDVAYYLAKNPDEAARILAIQVPVREVAELGRIANRLTIKPIVPPKPAPIRALKTGSEAAVQKSPSEMSMDEYGARRIAQINAEKRARMGLAN